MDMTNHYFFYDKDLTKAALRTHPWVLNPKYTTPPARTMYRSNLGAASSGD